jgi:hypothetical protein
VPHQSGNFWIAIAHGCARNDSFDGEIMGVLDGRVALVTGGSKGLDAATARLLSEAGAPVVITFGCETGAVDELAA